MEKSKQDKRTNQYKFGKSGLIALIKSRMEILNSDKKYRKKIDKELDKYKTTEELQEYGRTATKRAKEENDKIN